MNNLTPEQLAQIRSMGAGQYGTNIGGTFYQPHYSSNAQGEAGMGQGGELLDIYGYDPTKTDVGQQYSMYSGGGDYTGQGQFKKVKDGDLLAGGLLAAISMGTLLPGAMAGSAVAGDAFLPGALASTGGASVPFGSVIPGLEAFAAPLGTGSAAAFNAAMDSQLANAAIDAAGGSALSGYQGLQSMLGLPTMSPIAPGLLDSLANGAKSLLGPLASKTGMGLATTALGGLLGSKGQEEEMTKTSKIDPRLDPYIYGDQGILKQVNDLKNQQLSQGGLNDLQRQGMQMTQNWLTSPEHSQGYSQMQNLGMGLLGKGIAGNPFAK
jgi:hypothetical protein